jgi:hypothetical protein
MKRTLRQIAEKVNVSWVRIGFNPETEMTDFVAVINGQTFSYHTGILACIPDRERALRVLRSKLFNPHTFDKIIRGSVKLSQNLGNKDVEAIFNSISSLAKPTAYDLLYSLQLDCASGDRSFADWCADFGYDSDSIKALNVYQACCDTIPKLRKALGDSVFRELMECEDVD